MSDTLNREAGTSRFQTTELNGSCNADPHLRRSNGTGSSSRQTGCGEPERELKEPTRTWSIFQKVEYNLLKMLRHAFCER